MKPNPGEMVVLTAIPQGFLDDLPEEDQQAIREIVGKPVLLNEYDGGTWAPGISSPIDGIIDEVGRIIRSPRLVMGSQCHRRSAHFFTASIPKAWQNLLMRSS